MMKGTFHRESSLARISVMRCPEGEVCRVAEFVRFSSEATPVYGGLYLEGRTLDWRFF